MSAKSYNKLSSMLEEFLSQNLDGKKAGRLSVQAVMSAWEAKKGEVCKLLGGGTTRTKRKKDPNAPKKWKTGYIIFCTDQREKLKSKNPSLSATELTTKLGEAWKGLSDKEKKKYESRSAEDKVRYEEELKSYVPSENSEEDSPPKSGRSRTKKERTGPKRPMSAYLYFCQKTRPELKVKNPTLGGKEATSELANRWNALSDKQKEPFAKMHLVDKERYEKEKASLSGPVAEEKAPSGKAPSGKAPEGKAPEGKAGKSARKAPAEVPSTDAPKSGKSRSKPVAKTPGYNAFYEERLEDLQSDNPEWSQKKLDAEISKNWQALSSDDREAYEQEAQHQEDDEEEEVEEVEEDDDE